MVLGATNRPNHVDNAILRRLPRLFKIELPDAKGRLQILTITLNNSNHPVDVTATKYLPQLAKLTIGYSGSDLKELLNCAALEAVREVMHEKSKMAVMAKKKKKTTTTTGNNKKKKNHRGKKDKENKETETEIETTNSKENENEKKKEDEKKPILRPMSAGDLKVAMTKVKRTGAESADYDESQNENDARAGRGGGGAAGAGIDANQLLQLLMASLSQQQQQPRQGKAYNADDSIPEL